MKRFNSLILIMLFLSACSGSGAPSENIDVVSNGASSSPVSTDVSDVLCDDVLLLTDCSDEYKGLEVKEWINFFNHHLNEDYEYQLAGGFEAHLFECGSLISSKAQMVFSGALYEIIENEFYEIFENFVDIDTCSTVENIESVFRRELENL